MSKTSYARMKPPPRLHEALIHIEDAGNLVPMRDVTVPQLDRLWDYIDSYNLAVMAPAGQWALTESGRALVGIHGAQTTLGEPT